MRAIARTGSLLRTSYRLAFHAPSSSLFILDNPRTTPHRASVNIYAATAGQNSVPTRRLGDPAADDANIVDPLAIAVDRAGRVYLADSAAPSRSTQPPPPSDRRPSRCCSTRCATHLAAPPPSKARPPYSHRHAEEPGAHPPRPGHLRAPNANPRMPIPAFQSGCGGPISGTRKIRLSGSPRRIRSISSAGSRGWMASTRPP